MASVVVVILLALPWVLSITFGPAGDVVQRILLYAGAVAWVQFGAFARVRLHSPVQIIAVAWAVAAICSGVMGLLQYHGLADVFGQFISAAESGQAYANLRQRNQLATLLCIGNTTLLWWSSRTITPAWRCDWVLWLGVTLLATANAATASRTGLLELLLVSAMWLRWHGDRALLALSVVAYVAAICVLPILEGMDPFSGGILSRVSKTGQVCISRLTLWANVLHLISQEPLLGWGWGELDYAHYITLYPSARFCEILDNAHNLPLHLAVELGLPVATLFCGVCGWFVWQNRPWAEIDPNRQLAWGVLAVIGVHSMLEYPLWYGPFQLATLLCIWILWETSSKSEMTRKVTEIPRIATDTTAAVLMTVCAIAAWDYWRISQIYMPPADRHAMYREDTLNKIRHTWFFRDQVKFAELTTTPLTTDNAASVHALALEMLHFSPEPRVIEKVVESAVMLGRDAEARYYLTRYKAAFPAQHARWSSALKMTE